MSPSSSSSTEPPAGGGAAAESPAGAGAAPLPAELAPVAEEVFGDRLPLAVTYADFLASEGVVRGLVGPREGPRMWDRHLLNCAVVAELLPARATVIDVGSGAGLPGLVLAIARPDLSITLVESMARRTAFLAEAIALLGLEDHVAVVRGRAEEPATRRLLTPADIVTARAVASLDRLAEWCLPLTKLGGRVLAFKGASAAEEVAAHRDVINRCGGGDPIVKCCGVGMIDPPTTIVEIVKERDVVPARGRSPRKAAGSGRHTPRDGRRRPGRGRSRRG